MFVLESLVVVLFVLHQSSAVIPVVARAPQPLVVSTANVPVIAEKGASSPINTCDVCWAFLNCCMDDLINVILNGGGKSCAAICSNIPNTLYAGVCTALCDAVGFVAFTALLTKADTYPIHLCIDFYSCTANTCKGNCGKITQFALAPQVAQSGQQISVGFDFYASQSIGTGEIYLSVAGPDVFGSPRVISQHQLIPFGLANGTTSNYSIIVNTAGYVIPCPSGVYKGNVSICAGDCQDTDDGVVLGWHPVSFTLN